MRVTHNVNKVYGTAPCVVTENEAAYTFELAVPGYAMDDITVGIKPTELRISATPKKDVAQGSFTGGFTNVFGIDSENPDMEPSNTEGRSITMANGVLTLVIPKHSSCVAETLEITAG